MSSFDIIEGARAIWVQRLGKFYLPYGAYYMRHYQGTKDGVEIKPNDYSILVAYMVKRNGKVIKIVKPGKRKHPYEHYTIREKGDIHVLFLLDGITYVHYKDIRHLDIPEHPLKLLDEKLYRFHSIVNCDGTLADRGYYGIHKDELAKLTHLSYHHYDRELVTLYPEWIKERIKPADGIYYLPLPLINPARSRLVFTYREEYKDETTLVLHKHYLPPYKFTNDIAVTHIFNIKREKFVLPPEECKKSVLFKLSTVGFLARVYVVPKNEEGKTDLSIVDFISSRVVEDSYFFNPPTKEAHEILGESLDGLSLVFQPMLVSLLYSPDSFSVNFQGDYLTALEGRYRAANVYLEMVWNRPGSLDIYMETIDGYCFSTDDGAISKPPTN
jgi:hypothetical protein